MNSDYGGKGGRWRRVLQIAFGLAVGLAARLLHPGHSAIGMSVTAALSLIGALGGELAAERVLPDPARASGFVAAAIGAIAALLIYGIAS